MSRADDLARDALRAIEARRQRHGISQVRLAMAVGMDRATYQRLVKRPRLGRIADIDAALTALIGERRPGQAETFRALRELFDTWVAFIARKLGLDPVFVRRCDGHRSSFDPAWRRAALCRAIAIYCLNVCFGWRQAQLGAALGLSRVRICQVCAEIEERRERDREIGALVDETMTLILGEAVL